MEEFLGAIHPIAILFQIQKRIIRIIMHAGYRDSCHPLLNILPLYPQYILLLSTFVVKNIDASKANSAIHSINTEKGFDLHPPMPNLTKAQNAIYYCGNKIFCNLPLNIKHLSHVTNKFKSALRKFLLASVLTDHTSL
jgi:hypothetical protein